MPSLRSRRSAGLALTVFAVAVWVTAAAPAQAEHARHGPSGDFLCRGTVRMSPHGGAERLVVDTLGQARERVRAALYGLTSPAIEAALRDLARGGVRVAIKADHVQSAGRTQAATLARLAETGVTVEISQVSRLLHDKFAVIDGRWVITGSFNWTSSAENRNRENVLVFDCPELARIFEAEWEAIVPDAP
ncbi:MAG TPA: phospholipase D-like domain-containing protein [Methylomirabilota bacterium]|nr:phospholipase D-like domain-containing protein [Methylomirabilota bacterium]